jgi:hypothetical protein
MMQAAGGDDRRDHVDRVRVPFGQEADDGRTTRASLDHAATRRPWWLMA